MRERLSGDERFLITMKGLYGYIDKSGKVIIPPNYTVASEFRENRALFGRDWRGSRFSGPGRARNYSDAVFVGRILLGRHGHRFGVTNH